MTPKIVEPTKTFSGASAVFHFKDSKGKLHKMFGTPAIGESFSFGGHLDEEDES